jgi:hypothetical protein
MIEVIGSGTSFALYRGAKQVAGPYWNKETALRAAERIEKQAKVKKRPCMHCRRAFTSEGPHNRLCNDCRRL